MGSAPQTLATNVKTKLQVDYGIICGVTLSLSQVDPGPAASFVILAGSSI